MGLLQMLTEAQTRSQPLTPQVLVLSADHSDFSIIKDYYLNFLNRKSASDKPLIRLILALQLG